MGKTYLKRIAAPKTWSVLRKTGVFITRPKPSGHSLQRTLPMAVILRDYLGIVRTAGQANKVLKTLDITVNGRRARTISDSAGFMDIVTVGKDAYRILIDSNSALTLVPAKDGLMIRRLAGKTTLPGGKVQLNLDGGQCLVAKDSYKVGDSLVLKDGKVADHLPLAKGASVLVTGGSHIGLTGNVESIDGRNVTVKTDGETFQTTKAYAYVIGKDKPLIG